MLILHFYFWLFCLSYYIEIVQDFLTHLKLKNYFPVFLQNSKLSVSLALSLQDNKHDIGDG